MTDEEMKALSDAEQVVETDTGGTAPDSSSGGDGATEVAPEPKPATTAKKTTRSSSTKAKKTTTKAAINIDAALRNRATGMVGYRAYYHQLIKNKNRK